MMETVRDKWTDERLDDLKDLVVEQGRRMDLGFAEVRSEMRHEIGSVREEIGWVREEIGSVRGEVGGLRAEMREEFGTLHERFDRLQQAMIYLSGVMIAALIGVIATQL